MKKEDFVSTIGYSGITAIVDKKQKNSKMTFEQLLEKGYFKAAFSKALYEGDIAAQERVLKAYNDLSSSSYSSLGEMKRLFGVFQVPEKITKAKGI